ncbi:MAG: hypothetical protein ACFCU5_04125 [Pleurocapsa sp.]
MQNKQKVTLYIPPELHRQLKIKAAIETESMSALVQKAITFYMRHPEKVEEIEASTYGKTHQVHFCPECDSAVILQEGKMVSLNQQASAIAEEISLDVRTQVDKSDKGQGQEELVPCL